MVICMARSETTYPKPQWPSITVVVGVSRVAQLEQLVEATEIALDPADVAYLEELYEPLENLLSLGFS